MVNRSNARFSDSFGTYFERNYLQVIEHTRRMWRRRGDGICVTVALSKGTLPSPLP